MVERQLKELGIQPRAVIQTSAKRMTDRKDSLISTSYSKLMAKSGLFEVQSVLGDLQQMADILKEQKQQLEQLRTLLLTEVEKVFQKEKKAYQVQQKRVKKENKELSEALNPVYRRLQQIKFTSIKFIFSHHLGCSSMKKQARQLISSAQSAQKRSSVHSRLMEQRRAEYHKTVYFLQVTVL